MLGGLFIIVVLFMPKGIVGLPEQLRELKKKYLSKRRAEVPVTGEALGSKAP